MNPFHRHKWTILRESYSPPIEVKKIESPAMNLEASSDLVMKILEFNKKKLLEVLDRCRGVRTIIFQCEKCGEIRKEEMWGEEVER